MACIAVVDTGEGIPNDTITRVFEPFFSTRGVGKGSGLGLPMVDGFAQQSGGCVKLESQQDAGTEVSIFLPLSESGPNADLEAANSALEAGSKQRSREEICVAIVEDDNSLRSLLCLKLERDGFQVVSFADGDSAEQAINDNRKFDLIISDQVMPGVTQGSDLLALSKSRMPTVPVIIMSGYIGSEAQANSLLVGADLFLEKPISLNDVTAHIDRMCNVAPDADGGE